MDLREPDLRPLTRIAAGLVALVGASGIAASDPNGAPVPPWVRVAEFRHAVDDYAPTRTASGTPLHWGGSCVFLRPHIAGAADGPALDTAVAAAAAGWEAPTRTCGYLRFVIDAAEAGESTFDHVNRVIVREDRWCRPGPPEKCYDEGAVGITTVYFVERPGAPDDGVILDADIELNAVTYALATCDGQPGGCTTTGTGLSEDLQNVLTHELGHLIGLDHVCWSSTPDTAPLDGDGVPVPPCGPTLPQEIKDTTMYNFVDPEEIAKRTLEADDIAGFCARYPAASDPGVCAPVEGPDPGQPDAGTDSTGDAGGCCGAGGGPTSLVLAAAVGLGLTGRRRKARR